MHDCMSGVKRAARRSSPASSIKISVDIGSPRRRVELTPGLGLAFQIGGCRRTEGILFIEQRADGNIGHSAERLGELERGPTMPEPPMSRMGWGDRAKPPRPRLPGKSPMFNRQDFRTANWGRILVAWRS
jgi:hypothetical protein